MRSRVRILGVPVDRVDLDGASTAVSALVARGTLGHVVTLNVDFLAQADRDAELHAAIHRADLVVADGVPLLWMARVQGTPLPGRVNGTDLMMRLLSSGAPEMGWRVALVGGEEGVAVAAADEARHRWGVDVVLAWAPTRAEIEAGAPVTNRLREAGAELLFLALGGGRQERWVARNREHLRCVCIGVGSALDFLAGRIPRAPSWMQRSGLEWGWRLAHEPTRLWRRYLVDDPVVLAKFARDRVRAIRQ